MAVSQREVYLLPFPVQLDDPHVVDHLFIVLSIEESNSSENTFIGVMITSSGHKDDHSFDLLDEMFESPLKKNGCHVRMHLLTLCVNEDIVGQRKNKMKEFYFNQLMKSIGDLVFNFNFKPAS